MSSYVNGLLLAVIRPALASGFPDAVAWNWLPADYAERLPCVVARETSGGARIGPRLETRTRVSAQIDAYVDTHAGAEPRDGFALCDAAVNAVIRAWERQTVTPDGHLGVPDVSGPSWLPEPGRADGVERFVASLTLLVRPPVAA